MKVKIRLIVIMSVFGLALQSCKKIDRLKTDINFPAAYVINGESNSISVINIETNSVVETAEFHKGSWPHHIYSNSSKDKLVISLTGVDLSGGHAGHGGAAKSFLIVLNAVNFEVEGFLKTDAVAHNAIFMNSDQEIWLPQMTENGEIKILNSKSLKEISSIGVGNGPLEITVNSTGNFVFVANGEDNTISIIDVATKTVTKTINVGIEPVGAWPGSNNKMYVDCEVSKQIFEIDATTLEITDTINLAYTPAYVNYNSLTTELWVSDAQFGGIHTYELISNQWVENGFLPTGDNAHAITFNTLNDKAYVTNQNSATVSVIDAVLLTKIADVVVGNKPNGILIIE